MIDTATASAAIAMLALAVQRRLERGTTDEEIDDLVDALQARGGPDLHARHARVPRRGAVGSAAPPRWAGQLLHIKPILTLEDGEVLPLKRVRGNRKAIQEFAEAFRTATSDEPGLRVGVAHADAPERMAAVEQLVRDVRSERTRSRSRRTLGPVVGTHAGPGTVGLFWFQD